MNSLICIPVSTASLRLLGLTTCATGVLFCTTAHAQNLAKTWDNGGGDNAWLNPLNWSGDTLPATGISNLGDNLTINLGGANKAIYSTGTNVYRSIRVGIAGTGVLDITGGTLSSDNSMQTRIGSGTNTGNGTINQSGGTVQFGGWTQIGLDANTTGTYNLSGGSVTFDRDSGTANATVAANTSLMIGDGGTGLVKVSGGSLTTRAGVQLGRLNGVGTGTFHVVGSTATAINIGSFSTVTGTWTQNAGSTLRFDLDNGGATKIFIDQVGGVGGNVSFASGSLLDVGFMNSSVAGTWILMEWEGTLTNNGLAFAPGVDTNIWSFSIDEVAKTLSVTSAIPEPSAFAALAGLGALGLACTRRRR